MCVTRAVVRQQGDCNHWLRLFWRFNLFFERVEARGDVRLSMTEDDSMTSPTGDDNEHLAMQLVKILETTAVILENCISLHVHA